MKRGFTIVENLITLLFVFFIVLFINSIITISFKYYRNEKNRFYNYIEFQNLFNRIISSNFDSMDLTPGNHKNNKLKIQWDVIQLSENAKEIRFYSYKLNKTLIFYYSRIIRR